MNKLSEMTLEELWQLFPIVLTEHDENWAVMYAEESRLLRNVLPQSADIYHIGSTAIDGIWAKPIVDILVNVAAHCDIREIARAVCGAGYIVMSETDGRVSLNKGYTEHGFADRVFHVHLQNTGNTDEVLFRDYLNAHSDVAKEYERLKLALWKKFEHDRDGYTAAKSEFVKKYTAKAKEDNP